MDIIGEPNQSGLGGVEEINPEGIGPREQG